MKKYNLLLILLFLGILPYQNYSVVRVNAGMLNNAFAVRDSGKYILSIDQSKISVLKDKIIEGQKFHYVTFSLNLTNTSNDTLKYINMSCEWWCIYHFDNIHVNNLLTGCDKNVLTIITIAPHKTRRINYPIIISKSFDGSRQKFRVGMNLVKYTATTNLFDLFQKSKNLRFKGNMIWSNQITIP